MSFYQIKLTPADAYFFGGEKHSKNGKNPNGFEMDYFTRSELYPQQTSLLGVLRYYLLMKNDLLNPQKTGKTSKANKLIGELSFSYGYGSKNGGTVQDFGIIKRISPLYFRKDDTYFKKENQKYIVAPFGHEYNLEINCGHYILKSYDAKEGYNSALMNLKDNNIISFFKIPENKNDNDFVFIPFDCVGNKKGEKGKSEEDGFYKQTRYRLNKGWSFAFDAEIDDTKIANGKINQLLDNDRILLPFGAERQMFSLEITGMKEFTDLTLKNSALPIIPKDVSYIFCISDCFVKENIWENVVFAVDQNVSFRNLESKTSAKNYSSFSKDYSRSYRYNLLKRGSMLYFKGEEKKENAIKLFQDENAKKIGFNHIQTL